MKRKITAILVTAVFVLGFVAAFLSSPGPAHAYNWKKVGSASDISNSAPASMIEFDNRLFLGTSDYGSGGRVFAYSNNAWESMCQPGFGSEHNVSVSSLTIFRGSLHAGTLNMNGAQLWRYEGGLDWTEVSTGQFASTDFTRVTSMATSNVGGTELLYVSIFNSIGCGVWTYDGASWNQVVGQDPAGTPGTGPGFGNKDNIEALLADYQGKIHAGTGMG